MATDGGGPLPAMSGLLVGASGQGYTPGQPGSSVGERQAQVQGRKIDNFIAKESQATGRPVQCKDCRLYLKKFECAWQTKIFQGPVQEFLS
ncbi:MAG: hypothetical protein ACKPKO_51395 [Candidatus Fonsibacter sp.]